MKRLGYGLAALTFVVAAVLLLSQGGRRDRVSPETVRENEAGLPRYADSPAAPRRNNPGRANSTQEVGESDHGAGGPVAADEPPMTEADLEVAEADAKVDAFDALTDKWMEPSKTDVTLDEVDMFVKAFRRIPKDRQDECVHRALNLVPDENVMLLAGLLLDRSVDKEIVGTVFNDILNRDEAVKKPILLLIYKDKTHPCWSDAAWILDVTGE